MPSRRSAAMSRKLKSGKSMATNTSGRCSRAAATSRRSIANDRGRTRSASVRPVTEKRVKSPSSVPPAASRRGPPNPKISTVGARCRSSVASAPAYRSPEASPHEIMIRMRALLRAVEQGLGNRLVEGERRKSPLHDRLAVVEKLRLVRKADAVDLAVVREDFFGQNRAAGRIDA